MSTLGYFTRNSMFRLFSLGVTMAMAFVVTPHMLRCLENSGYGVWMLISTLAGYFMLLDLGLFQAVSKHAASAYAAGDEERCRRVYSTALFMGGLTCLVALILSGILALCIDRFTSSAAGIPSAGTALGVFSASVAVLLLFRASQAILTAQLRWNILAGLSMLHAVFNCVLTLWLLAPALSVTENLLRLALIMACGNVLEYVGHFCLTLRTGRPPLRLSALSAATAKDLLRYGLPVIVSNLGTLLKRRTQIFIVASFLGLSAVTLFSLAQQLINYMSSVMLSAFGIMSPYFSRMQARGEMENCRRALLESMEFSYAAAAYLGLCVIFYGGLFLARWLGPQYGSVQALLLPLGLAGIINFGSGVVSGFLLGIGAHRFQATLSVGEGLCGTAFAVPAACLYGMEGVAWVMAAATFTVQLGILPAHVCRTAELRPGVYYRVLLGTVAVQVGAQGLYYLCVMNRLSPDYGTLALACAGQFAVTALTLGLCIRFRQRAWQEVAKNALP